VRRVTATGVMVIKRRVIATKRRVSTIKTEE
jgi:hypothetical protein